MATGVMVWGIINEEMDKFLIGRGILTLALWYAASASDTKNQLADWNLKKIHPAAPS
jgi:hypothetical protein